MPWATWAVPGLFGIDLSLYKLLQEELSRATEASVHLSSRQLLAEHDRGGFQDIAGHFMSPNITTIRNQ